MSDTLNQNSGNPAPQVGDFDTKLREIEAKNEERMGNLLDAIGRLQQSNSELAGIVRSGSFNQPTKFVQPQPEELPDPVTDPVGYKEAIKRENIQDVNRLIMGYVGLIDTRERWARENTDIAHMQRVVEGLVTLNQNPNLTLEDKYKIATKEFRETLGTSAPSKTKPTVIPSDVGSGQGNPPISQPLGEDLKGIPGVVFQDERESDRWADEQLKQIKEARRAFRQSGVGPSGG